MINHILSQHISTNFFPTPLSRLCLTLSLALPFNETLFALSLDAHHHVTPAPVSLNVTSHLWLRPVLFIAGQLKCEGSQWEDKYKGQGLREGVADEGWIILPLASLSSPPNLKGKKTGMFD